MTPIEFNRRVESIPVYPAAETYEYDGELVKLASNETPWEPLPEVLDAAREALRGLNRYPDPEKSLLRRRIAERCDVSPAMVAVGNGSCEILLAAAEAMLEPGAEIVYAWPSFSMYPQLAAMTGSTAITVPLDAEGRHDLEAMAREVTHATRVVVICNPNNPGHRAPRGGHRRLRRGAAATRGRDRGRGLRRVLHHPGSRRVAGAGAPPPQRGPAAHLLEGVRPLRPAGGLRDRTGELPAGGRPGPQPFSVNALAQAAAAEALLHQDEVERRVERTAIERLHVESELEERGLETTDSQANFSWFGLGDREEADVVRGLAERGVIVRAGTALGQEGWIRVTYGTRRRTTASCPPWTSS